MKNAPPPTPAPVARPVLNLTSKGIAERLLHDARWLTAYLELVRLTRAQFPHPERN